MEKRSDSERCILEAMTQAREDYLAALGHIKEYGAGDKRSLDLIDRYAHTLHELAAALQCVSFPPKEVRR